MSPTATTLSFTDITMEFVPPSRGGNFTSLLDNYRMFLYGYFALRFLLSFLIFTGNMLTIISIIKFEGLQSNTNFLVASLAVADFISFINPMFVIITTYFPHLALWIHLCLFGETVNMLSTVSNMYNILWITIDRYLFIALPLRYPSLVTRARVVVLLGATWLFSLVCSSSVMYAGNRLREGMVCRYGIFLKPVVFNAVLLLQFYALLGLTVIIYICIGIKAWKQAKKQKMQERIATSFQQTCEAVEAEEGVKEAPEKTKANGKDEAEPTNQKERQRNVKLQSKKRSNDHKITKLLAMVIGFYIGTLIPQAVVALIINLMGKYATTWAFYLDKCMNIMWWSSAAWNPIIYAWKNGEFRRAFKKILALPDNRVEPSWMSQ